MKTQPKKLYLKTNYDPEPKQTAFHTSSARFRLYLGAWRGGKTFAGCQEAFNRSVKYPKNEGLIGRKDYTDLLNTTYRTFKEICPEKLIKKEVKNPTHYIELVNGSIIHFKGLKDEGGLGSYNLGWFYVDEAEEVQENIFERLKGRLSLIGVKRLCGWLTSNPSNKDHWLYRHFIEKKDPDNEIFYASTYENKRYLPTDYIPSLEKFPESWKRKYLFGEFGFTPDGTPFYNGFKEILHKRKLDSISSRPLMRIWDYGYHHPAVSFHQIDSKGRWLVLREIMGTDITIQEFGNYIKTRCQEWYPDAQWIDYGDPAGTQKTDKSEKTSVEILASMGIAVTSKPSTYRERKEIIERRLATLIDGVPSLLVDENCKIIIDGFLGGYHYPIRKSGQAYNPHIFEVPYRDGYYEHLMNTIEYFAVNMFEGAESKDDEGEMISKVIGPFKDVKYEIEDSPRYSKAYRDIITPPQDRDEYEKEPQTVRYVAG